jgi:uncharacterized protein
VPDRPPPVPARPELPEGVWRPEPPPPSPRDALPRWPLWAPFMAMLGVFVFLGVLLSVADPLGLETGPDAPPGVNIGATYVQDLALIASALVLARLLDPPATPRKFGLRLTPLLPAAGWTIVSWFGFFAFTIAWSIALDIDEQDDLPEELGVDESTAALVGAAILVCVLAPVAEELFFRGFCFTALRRTVGMLPAAALTGIIFGAIHLGGTDIEFIVPLMVFGFFLCLLYVWTESLLPCIALHALNNALALGVSQDWGAATALAMAAAAALSVLVVLPFARRGGQAVPA